MQKNVRGKIETAPRFLQEPSNQRYSRWRCKTTHQIYGLMHKSQEANDETGSSDRIHRWFQSVFWFKNSQLEKILLAKSATPHQEFAKARSGASFYKVFH
jgi:hypothetical protein